MAAAVGGINSTARYLMANGSAPDDKAVLSGLSDQRGAAVIADLTYREDALAFGKIRKPAARRKASGPIRNHGC